MHKTSLTRRLLLTALAAMSVGAAQAQNFPSKPVTLMVPYPAGGLSDVLARMVNNPLAKQLGQPVIVENLGGVSGAIAAQKVLNAPADGHYVFQGSPNELILSPLANAAVKFKSEDFRLVQMIGAAQMGGVCAPRHSGQEHGRADRLRPQGGQGRQATDLCQRRPGFLLPPAG